MIALAAEPMRAGNAGSFRPHAADLEILRVLIEQHQCRPCGLQTFGFARALHLAVILAGQAAENAGGADNDGGPNHVISRSTKEIPQQARSPSPRYPNLRISRASCPP